MASNPSITQLLVEVNRGDAEAMDALLETVYRELSAMADRRIRSQRAEGRPVTLDPTALVHETFLKLAGQRSELKNRRHFFAIASRIMTRVLRDHLRHRNAEKRGGHAVQITLSRVADLLESPDVETSQRRVDGILQALDRLDEESPRRAELGRLRILWGLELAEIAEALEVSLATVKRDWRFVRAWLEAQVESGE
jgi:RNA polymerase sigma factor (TIGR02999 family)